MKKNIQRLLFQHWDALIASAIACIAIYYLTRFGGIGISPDSVEYAASAINLKQKNALLGFNGFPMVDFPAGYPLFLSAWYFITGIEPIHLAPVINAVLYVGVILMSSFVMTSFDGIKKWYRIAFLILVSTSPCLWEIYGMVWSETLFLFLTLLFILSWKNYSTKKSYSSLLIFSLVAALAFLTRYAGITLVITGAALLFFDGSLELFKKIKQLIIFIAIGFSLVLLNILRNKSVSGTMSGVREKALKTVADNLLSIGSVIANWFPLIGEHYTIAAIVFCLLVIWAIVQIFYRIIQQQYYLRNETAVYGFFLVYSIFIVAIASISRFEDLSSRLLSPIYIPMIWAGTIWIPGFIQKRTKRIRVIVFVLLSIYFIAFFRFQYQQNASNWEGIEGAGIPGYSETQWKASPTVKYINEHKELLKGPIYSDADDGLYFLTGIISLALPHKEVEEEKKEFLSHPNLIVVWFNDGVNTDLIDLDYINAHKSLQDAKKFEDGAIYFYSDSVSVKH